VFISQTVSVFHTLERDPPKTVCPQLSSHRNLVQRSLDDCGNTSRVVSAFARLRSMFKLQTNNFLSKEVEVSSAISRQAVHDIRNALNRIMGSAQLLEEPEPLSPRQKKQVDRILQSSREILATLENQSPDSAPPQASELKLDLTVVKEETPSGPKHTTAEKILLVDDDPEALDNYQQLLQPEFEVETAVGGTDGLLALKNHGPFAVVVSDMRMPGMSGVEFLASVRQISPETIRMMLTGHADATVAMQAVNHGHIFRFLTKPCEREVLKTVLSEGLVQHRLAGAEKAILENTLMGSIKVMTDVLSAVSPEAFGRSLRITRNVRHFIQKLRFPSAWHLEAAGMLSQLGCIMLEPSLVRAAYTAESLSTEDKARFETHPHVARDLLVRVPRLEVAAWMIDQQLSKEISRDVPKTSDLAPALIVRGAKILKLSVTLESVRVKCPTHEDAIARIPTLSGEFGQDLLEALKTLKPEAAQMQLRKVTIAKLSPGMILQEEIKTRSGLLVVNKGQEVTRALLARLSNFAESGMIANETLADVPI
jgi:response regulator RpfG family c-di-GMP phosphodiesterase